MPDGGVDVAAGFLQLGKAEQDERQVKVGGEVAKNSLPCARGTFQARNRRVRDTRFPRSLARSLFTRPITAS